MKIKREKFQNKKSIQSTYYSSCYSTFKKVKKIINLGDDFVTPRQSSLLFQSCLLSACFTLYIMYYLVANLKKIQILKNFFMSFYANIFCMTIFLDKIFSSLFKMNCCHHVMLLLSLLLRILTTIITSTERSILS